MRRILLLLNAAKFHVGFSAIAAFLLTGVTMLIIDADINAEIYLLAYIIWLAIFTLIGYGILLSMANEYAHKWEIPLDDVLEAMVIHHLDRNYREFRAYTRETFLRKLEEARNKKG